MLLWTRRTGVLIQLYFQNLFSWLSKTISIQIENSSNIARITADVRLFIRYDIDEALPWTALLAHRQLYGEEKFFLSLFSRFKAVRFQRYDSRQTSRWTAFLSKPMLLWIV
jgi:hypothetical protein